MSVIPPLFHKIDQDWPLSFFCLTLLPSHVIKLIFSLSTLKISIPMTATQKIPLISSYQYPPTEYFLHPDAWEYHHSYSDLLHRSQNQWREFNLNLSSRDQPCKKLQTFLNAPQRLQVHRFPICEPQFVLPSFAINLSLYCSQSLKYCLFITAVLINSRNDVCDIPRSS